MENRIKEEILLEIFSTHDFLLPKHIMEASKDISNLNLSKEEFSRLIIHANQKTYVGSNSKIFSTALRRIIKEKTYDELKIALSDLKSVWPELINKNTNLNDDKMGVINKYYQFQRNFVYSVLDSSEDILKNFDFYIFDFDPLYKVKYLVDIEKADKKGSLYKKCYDDFIKNNPKSSIINVI